jgi:hypothetical protein
VTVADWWAVPAAAALYLIGTAAHELTHVLVCWLTDAEILSLNWRPLEVVFRSPNPRVHAYVSASTVAVSVPILLGWLWWLLTDPWSWRWLGGAAVVGYFPRSDTDWEPVLSLFEKGD